MGDSSLIDLPNKLWEVELVRSMWYTRNGEVTHAAAAIPTRFLRFFSATSGPYLSISSRYFRPFRPNPIPPPEGDTDTGRDGGWLLSVFLRLLQSNGNKKRHISSTLQWDCGMSLWAYERVKLHLLLRFPGDYIAVSELFRHTSLLVIWSEDDPWRDDRFRPLFISALDL